MVKKVWTGKKNACILSVLRFHLAGYRLIPASTQNRLKNEMRFGCEAILFFTNGTFHTVKCVSEHFAFFTFGWAEFF